jgi:hypothetical protein
LRKNQIIDPEYLTINDYYLVEIKETVNNVVNGRFGDVIYHISTSGLEYDIIANNDVIYRSNGYDKIINIPIIGLYETDIYIVFKEKPKDITIKYIMTNRDKKIYVEETDWESKNWKIKKGRIYSEEKFIEYNSGFVNIGSSTSTIVVPRIFKEITKIKSKKKNYALLVVDTEVLGAFSEFFDKYTIPIHLIHVFNLEIMQKNNQNNTFELYYNQEPEIVTLDRELYSGKLGTLNDKTISLKNGLIVVTYE